MRLIERGTLLLGKYRVDQVIGRGGMGLVIKAWHLGLDEEVAIKVLRDDVALADETIARFIREAQAAAKLKSEHIARIIDVGTFADSKPYLVMEFLEGQDIGQLLAERGRLQPSLAIDLVIQACEGLAEAHSLGIVHRDIKPTNLFLTSRPDGSVLLKILDFGISKSTAGTDLSLTQTWSLLGSPAYMSPEQMRSARHVDARTDVWSLGAVLYEAIEGHLPFQAESFSEMCVMVAVDAPTPMSATPHELAPIVARCLAKNPAERYASVADLASDLACLAREPDTAQVLVDRMYRMLRRGALRRTPAGGVPVIGPAGLPPNPTPTPTGLRTAAPPAPPAPYPAQVSGPIPTPQRSRPVPYAAQPGPILAPYAAQPGPILAPYAAQPGPSPAAQPGPILARYPGYAGPVPALYAAPLSGPVPAPLASSTGLPRASEPSPATGVPVTVPFAAASPAGGVPSYPRAVTTPPFGSPAMPGRDSRPSYPSYPSAVPLPVPLPRDRRFLRPGFELPRGALALTTTQVIVRRERGWIVSLLVALVVLAAAAVVIVLHSQPAAARNPAGQPAAAGAASLAAPAPGSTAGR